MEIFSFLSGAVVERNATELWAWMPTGLPVATALRIPAAPARRSVFR